MATTQLVTCDRTGCKSVRSEKTAKDWITAGLLEDGIVFGTQLSIQVKREVDYCSPECAMKATALQMGWRSPGRPRGSKNRPKVEEKSVA
jgi:hypothetical protein